MPDELEITSERVDDVPLLLEQMKRLGLAQLLDEHYPRHGNWQGLSLGEVVVGWLSYVLSQGDHRLSHMQQWAEAHQQSLQTLLSPGVRGVDFSDDRLEAVLDRLGEAERWNMFEQALSRQTLRVYDLSGRQVRIDSSSAKGHVGVSESGLFQFGHSKDRRPDLPQVKINISVLDPLGLPLSTTVVSGECADDPLYVPEIKRVQAVLGRRGVLCIGDSKMAALATRAYVVHSGDYYLCPLPKTQLSSAQLEALVEAVERDEQPLTAVYREALDGEKPERIAEGYEYEQALSAQVDGEEFSWTERRLVVRSLAMAEKQSRALTQRLEQAARAITDLTDYRQGKKRFSELGELRGAGEALLVNHRVEGLLEIRYHTTTHERTVRGYKGRPARVETTHTFTVSTAIDQPALDRAQRYLGWRVYGVFHPQQTLSLDQAVLAYRSEFIVERGFERMKGKALALTPIYLKTDQRVIGLIHLLSIGLRVLSLVEFQVRQALQRSGETLKGLYAGNPKRATARPTSEAMLRAFKGLTLTLIHFPDQLRSHLSPLNSLQQRILELLGFPLQLYHQLVEHSSKPSLNLGET